MATHTPIQPMNHFIPADNVYCLRLYSLLLKNDASRRYWRRANQNTESYFFLFVRRQYQSGVFVIVFVIAAAEGGVCTIGAPDAAGAVAGAAAVLLPAAGAGSVLAAGATVEAADITNFCPILMRSLVMLLSFFSSGTVILYFLAITVRLSPATTV